MEEEKGSSSSSSSSRWNPTKEQIAILEGIYRQGIRTPSAEQIQQITGKLREFGGIEGKNVFYWFQNHKARQRQKQKQESFAYFSRVLHQPPLPPPILSPVPLPPPPHPLHLQACSDVCAPYCLPVSQVGSVGFYQPHFPNMYLQGAAKRRSRSDFQRMEKTEERNLEANCNLPSHPRYHYDHVVGTAGQINVGGADVNGPISLETLQLFPLHPTGILEKSGSSITSDSMKSETVGDGEGEGTENLPSFNFFGASERS